MSSTDDHNRRRRINQMIEKQIQTASNKEAKIERNIASNTSTQSDKMKRLTANWTLSGKKKRTPVKNSMVDMIANLKGSNQ